MKIYLAHSTTFDFLNELYLPLQAAPLFAEHTFILPHLDPAAPVKNSKDVIKTCDLVVAEVTYPSTGMGIELGWANEAGVPIVAIHRAETRPTSALGAVTNRIWPYTDVAAILAKALSP